MPLGFRKMCGAKYMIPGPETDGGGCGDMVASDPDSRDRISVVGFRICSAGETWSNLDGLIRNGRSQIGLVLRYKMLDSVRSRCNIKKDQISAKKGNDDLRIHLAQPVCSCTMKEKILFFYLNQCKLLFSKNMITSFMIFC